MSDEIEIVDTPEAFQPGDKVLIPQWLSLRGTINRPRSTDRNRPNPRVAVVERVLFSPLNMGPTIVLVKLYTGALVAFPVTDLERWRMHGDCATCTCKEPETTPETFAGARALGHVILEPYDEDDDDEADYEDNL